MRSGPPLWKVRRELARLGHDLVSYPSELARKVYFRRWYDHVTARTIRQTEGACPDAPEIGLYVVFPVSGGQATHLRFLDEMRAAGIAPVVVSNLPLSQADRTRFAARSRLVVERPNVGRDFGGYRDGILAIAPLLSRLDRLWLLNDSVWLVPGGGGWFSEARGLGADMVAATSNFALPRPDPDRFREIFWAPATAHRNFHYASYALGFGGRILRDPGFLRFWRRLDIRDDKARTVRRGEIGLSQWVLRHGFTHGATAGIETLDREISALPDRRLDHLARTLVIPDCPRLEAARQEVLLTDPRSSRGREDRIRLVLATVARVARAYALPAHDLPRGFPFIKKSPLRLSPGGAERLMTVLLENGQLVGEDILREAREMVRPDTPASPSTDRLPVSAAVTPSVPPQRRAPVGPRGALWAETAAGPATTGARGVR